MQHIYEFYDVWESNLDYFIPDSSYDKIIIQVTFMRDFGFINRENKNPKNILVHYNGHYDGLFEEYASSDKILNHFRSVQFSSARK